MYEKSNSFTAAIEELRVDVKSINTLINRKKSNSCDAYLTALYVLGERLLSYPLFRVHSNFDCISSVFFWKFLNERGFLNSESLEDGLKEIEIFIENLEISALSESCLISRKQKLRSLVIDFFGDYDQQYINYKNFWGMK